jgi:two-component system, OmpR family, phosphate regulon response regulator PhoB
MPAQHGALPSVPQALRQVDWRHRQTASTVQCLGQIESGGGSIRMSVEHWSMGSTKQTILVAMQDDIAQLVRYILEEEGYRVVTTDTFNTVLADKEAPDLIVLDAALVRKCNASPIQSATGSMSPLLLVIEGRERSMFPIALQNRSVDMIEKPLAPDVLISRIRLLLRRPAEFDGTMTLAAAGVEVNLQTYRITRNRRRVDVGPIEFRLLCSLLRCTPRVLSRRELINAAWPPGVFVDPRTVNIHIGRLRKALSARGEPNLIRTVRSAGYSFDHAEASAQDPMLVGAFEAIDESIVK